MNRYALRTWTKTRLRPCSVQTFSQHFFTSEAQTSAKDTTLEKKISSDIPVLKNELKKSLFQRTKESIATGIVDHQGNSKFYTVYGGMALLYSTSVHYTNEVVRIIQDMNISPSFSANLFYGAGIAHTLLLIASVQLAKYITSLAGTPSHGVIQEVMDYVYTNPALKEYIGDSVIKPGYFSTIATVDGHLRVFDDKGRKYNEWLAAVLKGKTDVLHSTLFPFVLSPFVEYLRGTPFTEACKKTVSAIRDYNNFDPKAVSYAEENDTLIRQQKLRNHYSGWERLWAPRRLQCVMHLTTEDSRFNGILLAEVEKSQTGLGSSGSGGFLKVNTLQFVDLESGKLVTLDGPERPVLIGNAQLSKLFETIPVAPVKLTEMEELTRDVTITKLTNPVVPPVVDKSEKP